jgi:hypothetical protein|tara:strand:+ start:28 stop:699 length:672 start_codon:yes stop_codon:yes gene_type:complete
MSTRYIRRDNNVILGLAKNGSQAIKQIHKRNPGWDILEESTDWKGIDIFAGHYDPAVTIFFPIRDILDRAKSELIQTLRDNYVKQNKPVNIFIDELLEKENNYAPKLTYFQNHTGKLFIEKIFFNNDWNGCKIKFFDLKEMSYKFNDKLGYNLEIPQYNTKEEDGPKVEILDYLNNIIFKKGKWGRKEHIILTLFSKHWIDHYRNFHIPFWKGIKTTKYWLEL